jgi:hypothetical protein
MITSTAQAVLITPNKRLFPARVGGSFNVKISVSFFLQPEIARGYNAFLKIYYRRTVWF